ncbi:hypothetical protein NAPIS_ORF01873 [Vairimorpha apis BRL 01]|uniref:Uncharacterized protein n=1 Tax=Vairimorpha apis BRL 01 TaxID=1037528 RepID=T0KZ56_9MICR|nr:hypothetical protein NAPIS_ORF01873 [Vairimorpha apis BRL 01]
MQSIVLKKTSESISLDRRRGYEWIDPIEDEVEKAVVNLVKTISLENINIEEAKLKINETKKLRDNQSEEYEDEIVLNNPQVENTNNN